VNEVGHLVGVGGIDSGELLDLLHPLRNRKPWPRPRVERGARRLNCPADVLRSRLRRLADRFLGVRGDHREPLLGCGSLPAAADEELVVGE